MKNLSALRQAIALMDERGQRALVVLAVVVVVSAAASAAMVASVLPFLSVLSDPGAIDKKSWLRYAYEVGGFSSQRTFLMALGVGATAITVVANLTTILRTYLTVKFTSGQRYALSRRLFDHYVRQQYPYFLTRNSTEFAARILTHSSEAVSRVFRPAVEIISSAISIAAILVVLFALNTIVALAAMVALGGIYGATWLMVKRKIRRLGRTRALASEESHRVVGETFQTIKAVKLYGLETYSSDMFEAPARRIAETETTTSVLSEFPRYAVQTIAMATVVLVCLIVIGEADGGAGLGKIIPLLGVFGFAGLRLIPELQRLYASVSSVQSGLAAIDRIHVDLESGTKYGATDEPSARPIRLLHGLELRGATFRYPNSEPGGITGVDLAIAAGERIGLVGSTGAGKSTLADVILGLLIPQTGKVIVDGRQITESDLPGWRRSVGYVPQHIDLRDASIAENIAYGVHRERIDLDRVRRCAEIAQISNFVEAELTDGYDTRVGERGIRLSGGQRQRLGIARALYRDVDLIVFDEATSALDNLTEREIMSAIDGLAGEKTIIVIAHRLSTVRGCDRILLMERGEIVALGNWEALFSKNDAFRELVNSGTTG